MTVVCNFVRCWFMFCVHISAVCVYVNVGFNFQITLCEFDNENTCY